MEMMLDNRAATPKRPARVNLPRAHYFIRRIEIGFVHKRTFGMVCVFVLVFVFLTTISVLGVSTHPLGR